MITSNCDFCRKEVKRYPSQFHKNKNHFCNKSCGIKYRNKHNNPSWTRDVSGEKNPMWGKHPLAWNKGQKGSLSPNWKGGLSRRKDGYYRVNVNGERILLHRYLMGDKLKKGQIVHHKDHNPSNNDLSNLEILESQSVHASLHGHLRKKK